MKAKYFERAMKVAELTKTKEREIHAIEFCHKNAYLVAFKITLDNGNNFIVDIYI